MITPHRDPWSVWGKIYPFVDGWSSFICWLHPLEHETQGKEGNISKSLLMWQSLGTPGRLSSKALFLCRTPALFKCQDCVFTGLGTLGGRQSHSEVSLYYSVTPCTACVPCWANYWLKMLLGKGKHAHYVAVNTQALWFAIYAVWKSHSFLLSLCVHVTKRPSNHTFSPGNSPSSLLTPTCHPLSLCRDWPGLQVLQMNC